MKLRYNVLPNFMIWDTDRDIAVCVATNKDDAELIAEALNTCGEYYNKHLINQSMKSLSSNWTATVLRPSDWRRRDWAYRKPRASKPKRSLVDRALAALLESGR